MDIYKEALRYLGYGRNEADKDVSDRLKICFDVLSREASPKYVSEILDIEVKGDSVFVSNFVFKSKNLSKNLKGCKRAVVFAATLGTGADNVYRRLSKTDMPMAVIADALATAMIEEFCDKICLGFKEKGYNLRPRFSPGYGDFDLAHQKDFMNILMCGKKIGLTLTDSLMLTPSKSVTAIMGISDTKDECNLEGCEVCEKTDCPFRRS